MIYLASPYSNPDPKIQEQNYLTAMDIVQAYNNKGFVLFSPIVYCHPMAVKYSLNETYEYWKRFNSLFITAASDVWFAAMPGYKHSVGMKAEYKEAKEKNKTLRIVVADYDVANWGQGAYKNIPTTSITALEDNNDS